VNGILKHERTVLSVGMMLAVVCTWLGFAKLAQIFVDIVPATTIPALQPLHISFAQVIGHAEPEAWPVFLGAAVAGVVLRRKYAAHLDTVERLENRFQSELRQAEAGLRVLGTSELERAYAKKWFIRVCRRQDEITRVFAERQREVTWVNYLMCRKDEGGSLILRWYARDMRLLALAKEIDATTSIADFQAALARDNLRLSATVVLGEEEIDLRREQLRRGQQKQEPWDEFL
jgi:hypothetical protein